MLSIEISNMQTSVDFDPARMREAAEAILRDAGVREARLSLAVVDDGTIHKLNRRFLQHDYPTDVLSFLLERDGDRLEGEVIVSADTAKRVSAEYSWPAGDELLLYAIHGTLHLVGHNDTSPSDRAVMRGEERRYLVQFGLEPPTTGDDGR
jgi:probable rRNA maturation factor